MNVFVIYDNRRDDIAICERELQRQGITQYGLWPAVTSGFDTVEAHIAASHKNVIRQAQEMNLLEVCVMESDVWFPAKGAWDYFLRNKPAEFDIWLAGAYRTAIGMEDLRRYSSFKKSKRGPLEPLTIEFWAGMHCYIMHQRYYNTFLESPEGHIDVIQEGRGRFRLCYPFAALQRFSWSATHKSYQDYNGELLPCDIYGGRDLVL